MYIVVLFLKNVFQMCINVELDDMDQTFLRRQHVVRVFNQFSTRYAIKLRIPKITKNLELNDIKELQINID
jgi:hypothetical protein